MGNYNRNNECAGCGEHIFSYHGKGCVYDPDFEPVAEEDNERTINDIKRELEEGAVNL
jgi:hypothetical protein